MKGIPNTDPLDTQRYFSKPWVIQGWKGQHDEAGCIIGPQNGPYTCDIRPLPSYRATKQLAETICASINAQFPLAPPKEKGLFTKLMEEGLGK